MVFVTGATGLIGSYLLLELSKRGKTIRAMKRKNSDLDAVQNLFLEFSDLASFMKIEWIEADLLDIPALEKHFEGIETIYHTAASVGFDDRSKKLIHEINVSGTENLVNLAISRRIPNFVYISTIAVLDELPGEKIITENSKFETGRAHSEYAISKKKAEMNVWRGSQEGLNVLVVYPSVVIGSLDGKRASEVLFKLALKKNAYATEGMTGYVDVRDVVFSMAELVEKEKWNESYILNSGGETYVNIFNHLRKRNNLGKAKLISKPKLMLVRFLSAFSRIFGGPYMSRASFQALTGKVLYSSDKIKNEIGIDFIPVAEALDFHADRYEKIIKQK